MNLTPERGAERYDVQKNSKEISLNSSEFFFGGEEKFKQARYHSAVINITEYRSA